MSIYDDSPGPIVSRDGEAFVAPEVKEPAPPLPQYGRKAMWSLRGEYLEVDSVADERRLRIDGWVDGHEHFSQHKETVLDGAAAQAWSGAVARFNARFPPATPELETAGTPREIEQPKKPGRPPKK